MKSSIIDKLQELIVWTQIRNFHSLRVVKQMYAWLVIVPVLARVFEKMPEHANIFVFEQSINIVLTLPFSWKIFYFSAVSFVISNLIYQFFCPRLIKDHPSFSHFMDEGKGYKHLDWYASVLGFPLEDNRPFQNRPLKEDQEFQDNFWDLHAYSNVQGLWFRVLSCVFLLIGVLLVSTVIFQGFLAVLSQSLQLGQAWNA